MSETTSTPTQVQYPWRAAIRTGLATLPVVAIVLASAWGILTEEIAQAGWVMPEWALAVGAGIVLAVSTLSTIVTRIMAIPAVSAWLTTLGIGPTPTQ